MNIEQEIAELKSRIRVLEQQLSGLPFEVAPKETQKLEGWYYANNYCHFLNIDNKTGWRLPTIEELNQIYQSENDFEKDWYWSSNMSSLSDYAQHLFFHNGVQGNRKKRHVAYIRAIRDLI